MPLQGQKLVMLGMSVRGEQPPHELQEPLVDGIHLRWAFAQRLGFPCYGFHLFRRQHKAGDDIWLSPQTAGFQQGPLGRSTFDSTLGQLSDDGDLVLTDDFPRAVGGGDLEFDLTSSQNTRFRFPQLARRAVLYFGYHQDARVHVRAYSLKASSASSRTTFSEVEEEIEVLRRYKDGQRGKVESIQIEADSISVVKIESAPAALVELGYVPVAQDAPDFWTAVPGFPAPMCLPANNGEYPCTLGAHEDLADARRTARNRIRYGDPGRLTDVRSTYGQGRVSVTTASDVVTGDGTDWPPTLAGHVIQLQGDLAGHTITQVVNGETLILSRAFKGASAYSVAYEISEDPFGQLHDSLQHLVEGGPGHQLPMAIREAPEPVDVFGVVDVTNGSTDVLGHGTRWTAVFNGLAFRLISTNAGIQP